MLRGDIPVPVPHLKFCLDDRVEILDLPRVMADQETRIEGLVEDHQSRVKLPSSESNPSGNRIRIQPFRKPDPNPTLQENRIRIQPFRKTGSESNLMKLESLIIVSQYLTKKFVKKKL